MRLLALVAALVLTVQPFRPAPAEAAPIDVCDLATEADVEAYRGLDIEAESLATQGNASRLRAIGAGESSVFACDYRFVAAPAGSGTGLSLGVFVGDMPDIPFIELYPPVGPDNTVEPIAAGDEGYWSVDTDAARGGIAPIVNPLWARIGDLCWFEFSGDLGVQTPGDSRAQSLLNLAKQVADRLKAAGCEVIASEGTAPDGSRPTQTPGSGGAPGQGPGGGGSPPSGGAGGGPGSGDGEVDLARSATLPEPPTVIEAFVYSDYGEFGSVTPGDFIVLVFSESLSSTANDPGSAVIVRDGDGTSGALACGADIECKFALDETVRGIPVASGQALGMVVGLQPSLGENGGSVPGLQYPLSIVGFSTGFVDLAQERIDLAGSSDLTIENDGAERDDNPASAPPSQVEDGAPVSTGAGGSSALWLALVGLGGAAALAAAGLVLRTRFGSRG